MQSRGGFGQNTRSVISLCFQQHQVGEDVIEIYSGVQMMCLPRFTRTTVVARSVAEARD